MALLASTLALAACGGGGSEIASAPPPVAAATSGPVGLTSATVVFRTPLPSTVATTAGTYDTLAWISDQAFDQTGHPGTKISGIASPSPIRLTIDPATPSFTIRGQFPEGEIQRTYSPQRTISGSPLNCTCGGTVPDFYDNFGYRVEIGLKFSDGSSGAQSRDIAQIVIDHSTSGNPSTARLYTSESAFEKSAFGTGIGLRYVSYGEWGFSQFVEDTSTRQTRGLSAQLVYGTRTTPADLPTNGSASYSDATGVLRLDADFGERTIAADLNYPAAVKADDEYPFVQVGIKASGSSIITSSADFAIPLAGTSITPDLAGKLPDAIAPVTGTFTGAFFGPQAAEVGGFAAIVKADGELLWSGVPYLLGRK